MDTVEIMRNALGPPQAFEQIGSGSYSAAAVGRWRHGGGRVDLRGVDMIRVLFNVSGGQDVEVVCGNRLVRKTIRAGTVEIVFPGDIKDVSVNGAADIFQFFLGRDLIEAVTGQAAPTELSQLGWALPKLQAAAVQALVALERPRQDAGPKLEAVVTDLIHMFAPVARPPIRRGGLTPLAMRRVQAAIDASLTGEGQAPPALHALARAAGLSMHHFVREYGVTTGHTPIAGVTASRLDSSLAMLLGVGGRVGDISEKMGFSSPSHFVSTFRKHLGVTPGALRHSAGVRR